MKAAVFATPEAIRMHALGVAASSAPSRPKRMDMLIADVMDGKMFIDLDEFDQLLRGKIALEDMADHWCRRTKRYRAIAHRLRDRCRRLEHQGQRLRLASLAIIAGAGVMGFLGGLLCR